LGANLIRVHAKSWFVKTDSSENLGCNEVIASLTQMDTSFIVEVGAGSTALSLQEFTPQYDSYAFKIKDSTICSFLFCKSKFGSWNSSKNFPRPLHHLHHHHQSPTTPLHFNLQLFDELGREVPLQFHTTQQRNNTMLTS